MANTNLTGRSNKKKKKNKRRGSRSSSRGSSRGSNEENHNKPDFEAEVIVKRKNSNVSNITRKEDLLVPVSAARSQRRKVQDDVIEAPIQGEPEVYN